ncbi:MAG: hypothetical protein M3N41_07925, partial [Acidobacteriota bacterium]|nr:hypothetical protein [Acidobacteriota bacterium]
VNTLGTPFFAAEATSEDRLNHEYAKSSHQRMATTPQNRFVVYPVADSRNSLGSGLEHQSPASGTARSEN